MIFVLFLLVTVIAISRFPGITAQPEVDLPTVAAERAEDNHAFFLVTVTTTHIEDNTPSATLGVPRPGECRAYLRDGTPVDSQELHDAGFRFLDKPVTKPGLPENARQRNGDIIPKAYVRADVGVPWRCVGGAIANLEQAGYGQVGLLTSPPS